MRPEAAVRAVAAAESFVAEAEAMELELTRVIEREQLARHKIERAAVRAARAASEAAAATSRAAAAAAEAHTAVIAAHAAAAEAKEELLALRQLLRPAGAGAARQGREDEQGEDEKGEGDEAGSEGKGEGDGGGLVAAGPTSARRVSQQTLRRLARPRYNVRRELRAALQHGRQGGGPPPPLVYGERRAPPRLHLASPPLVGDIMAARSTAAVDFGCSVVVTAPSLSARYRIPAFLPSTSRVGSAPPTRSPRSARHSARAVRREGAHDGVVHDGADAFHTVGGGADGDATRGGGAQGIVRKELHGAASRGDARKLRALAATLRRPCGGAEEGQGGGARRQLLEFAGTSFGGTPLLSAVQQRRVEAVRVLLAAGASVHARDKFGVTPLHAACSLDDEVMVELLLRSHADPLAKNLQQVTPLDCAVMRRNATIIRLCDQATRPRSARVIARSAAPTSAGAS